MKELKINIGGEEKIITSIKEGSEGVVLVKEKNDKSWGVLVGIRMPMFILMVGKVVVGQLTVEE